MLEELKEEVCRANIRLKDEGLVSGTSGNVSSLDRSSGLVVIKPSGVDYGLLRAASMVVVDLDGMVVEGNLNPSVDTPHHIYIYKNRPETGSVIHTHSRYAVMFAIIGREIPVLGTGHADIFGAGIPCAPYASNTGDAIGRAVIGSSRRGCPAVILERHGVFVFEENAQKALNTAAMLEHAAHTSYGAYQLAEVMGVELKAMPGEEALKWYLRHHGGSYGQ